MDVQCVITGCALVTKDGRWTPCDVYKIGSAFLMAKLNHPLPLFYDIGDNHYSEIIQPDDWFDTQRGIWIIPVGRANLNEAALKYISDNHPLPVKL